MKVLIADDHPIVRQGLRQLLQEEAGAKAVGEARDAAELLAMVEKDDWDLVILDIAMPGRGGLDALKQLKRLRPGLPVLVLSFHTEEPYVRRALKAGASGYLTKECVQDELVRAVDAVMAGGRYLSPGHMERLAFDPDRDRNEPAHEALSDREFQVMMLYGRGRTTEEIAGELSLSKKTVGTYRGRIFEKMGWKSTAEIIHYVFRNQLVR